MKTDTLFHRLFRLSPRSLFRLVRLRLDGEYDFGSITLKTTEKRFDGFMRRTDGEGPNVFVEIQGYDDKNIYWRSFREVCAWYEENECGMPFVLVLLFIDGKYDPGNRMLSCRPPCRLIRKNLGDCLKGLGKNSGELAVLKPLGLADRKENRRKLPELVPEWEDEIRSLGLPEHETKELTELLTYAVAQRFRKLTLEEVRKMIELTPLDQTVAGRELIRMGMDIGLEKGRQEGREEGREEGMEQGELIGRIRMAQRFLKRRISSRKTLLGKNAGELKAMLRKLESELGI